MSSIMDTYSSQHIDNKLLTNCENPICVRDRGIEKTEKEKESK